MDMNDLPDQRERDRRVQALTLEDQSNLGVRRTPHFGNRVIQADTLDGLAVDRGDQVAWPDSSLSRWRPVDWADHLQHATFIGQLQPDAAEVARRLALHLLPFL